MTTKNEAFEKLFPKPIGTKYNIEHNFYTWVNGNHHGLISQNYNDKWVTWQAAKADSVLEIARETARADSWVAVIRKLANQFGLREEDSNGSIADWKFINNELGVLQASKADSAREIAELKSENERNYAYIGKLQTRDNFNSKQITELQADNKRLREALGFTLRGCSDLHTNETSTKLLNRLMNIHSKCNEALSTPAQSLEEHDDFEWLKIDHLKLCEILNGIDDADLTVKEDDSINVKALKGYIQFTNNRIDELENKLAIAVDALERECANRCNEEFNPCNCREALKQINGKE